MNKEELLKKPNTIETEKNTVAEFTTEDDLAFNKPLSDTTEDYERRKEKMNPENINSDLEDFHGTDTVEMKKPNTSLQESIDSMMNENE